mgnify:FL=1
MSPERHFSDKCFEWRPKSVFIPSVNFSGFIESTGTTVGASTGAPVIQEISTLGMAAVKMDTAADVIDHLMMLPRDLDLKKPIKFRVHWTSGSATTADTIDWKVFVKGFVPDVTTIIEAATALTTVIAQDTVAGAYIYQTTAYGTLLGGTLAQNIEALAVSVEMDAFAAGLTEDKFLLGLEIVYSPKLLRGPDGMAHPATMPTTALGSQY